jgi:hypothetical protein
MEKRIYLLMTDSKKFALINVSLFLNMKQNFSTNHRSLHCEVVLPFKIKQNEAFGVA